MHILCRKKCKILTCIPWDTQKNHQFQIQEYVTRKYHMYNNKFYYFSSHYSLKKKKMVMSMNKYSEPWRDKVQCSLFRRKTTTSHFQMIQLIAWKNAKTMLQNKYYAGIWTNFWVSFFCFMAFGIKKGLYVGSDINSLLLWKVQIRSSLQMWQMLLKGWIWSWIRLCLNKVALQPSIWEPLQSLRWMEEKQETSSFFCLLFKVLAVCSI